MTTTEKPQTFDINEEELKKFNQDMIKSSLITPDQLYVELALLKDLTIGALLSFLKERKEIMTQEMYSSLYDKIIAKLPEYSARSIDDIEHFFPFMGVSTEQLKERLADKRYSAFIFHHAPATKFIDLLKAHLFVNVNHSAVIGKRDPIAITVNTYPLQLTKEDELITGVFLSTTLGINARVVYIELKDIRPETLLKFDEVYTYHLKELMDSEALKTAYSSMRFATKRLFVARLLGGKTDPSRNYDQEDLVARTRFDILTNFNFIPARSFSVPPVVVEEKAPNG
jgi:hypothetical protein